MTKIVYERTGNEGRGDCQIHIEGDGIALVRALVQIIFSLQNRLGLDVEKFCLTLPLLLAMEKESIEQSTTIDLSKMKKGGEK